MDVYTPPIIYKRVLNLKKFRLKKFVTRIFLKSTVILTLVSLTFYNASLAYLFDKESSIGNTFATKTLDLEIDTHNPDFLNQPLMSDSPATQSAVFRNTGSTDFKFSQEIVNATDSAQLCSSLNLKAFYQYYDEFGVLQKILKYNGPLSNFSLNLLGTDSDLQIDNSLPYYPNSDYLSNEHWYFYEVSLPTDPDPSLGNKTCSFDILSKAWQPELDYSLGFTDEELFSSSISTGSWAQVSGMKFNDLNGNSFKDATESGIPNWHIYAAQEVESFAVSSDGTAQTSQVLENGETYLIRVNGIYFTDTNHRADAKYSAKPPYNDWEDIPEGLESYGSDLLELQIDSASVDWGAYNDSHEYWLTYDGLGSALTFDIYDILYTNNTGSLDVTIFKVAEEVQTNSSGNYTIDLTDIDGEFIIAEKSQEGWVQTFPASKYYSFSTAANYENINFGNKEVEEQEIGKLVINEVYYDVDNDHGKDGGVQSDEWVELYNPNDFAINLKDWTITDNSATRSLSTSNRYIPAHGFAVLAKAANTWTFWSIPSSAEKIQLGEEIGNGLANTGDRVILKNKNGDIVDQISYGTDTSIHDPSIPDVAEGHSIARDPLGYDTDQASDWVDNPNPNPGTNPHSHIQVSVNQEDQHLLIGFNNAYGFDSLEYEITYTHLYGGIEINEAIKSTISKPTNQETLVLSPFYLGTCSGIEGLVCTPHQVIDPINISLTYKDGDNTLGVSNIEYNWK